jgi:hypothetical protein
LKVGQTLELYLQPIGEKSVPTEDAVDSLVRAWRAAGIKLNPPAELEQIAKLAAVLGIPIPNDVAAFYSLANGMAEYESDRYLVSFWAIDRILTDQNVAIQMIFGLQIFYSAVGDLSIDRWRREYC